MALVPLHHYKFSNLFKLVYCPITKSYLKKCTLDKCLIWSVLEIYSLRAPIHSNLVINVCCCEQCQTEQGKHAHNGRIYIILIPNYNWHMTLPLTSIIIIEVSWKQHFLDGEGTNQGRSLLFFFSSARTAMKGTIPVSTRA